MRVQRNSMSPVDWCRRKSEWKRFCKRCEHSNLQEQIKLDFLKNEKYEMNEKRIRKGEKSWKTQY